MTGFAFDMGCGFPQNKRPLPYDFDLGVGTVRADTLLPGEQTGTGRIVVVVHYKTSGQSHYFTLLDTTANLDSEIGVSFTLSGSTVNQIPADATELFLVVTYRGPLGQETDAVIGGTGIFSGLC